MRMSYITLATDYIRELKSKGVKGRKKAQAFMDYWEDMEAGDHNSYGFYAKAWRVSKSTAHAWIKEFDYEIDRFINSWELRKNYHYEKTEKLENAKQDRFVKNSTERIERLEANESNGTELPKKRGFVDSSRTISKNEPNEDINILEEGGEASRLIEKEVQELIDAWMFNGGNWGINRDELIRLWKSLRSKVPLRRMKEAIVTYVHDGEIKNRYGLTKFLELGVYALYVRVRMKVFNRESMSWIAGEYSKKEETLYTHNGNFKLSHEVIVNKYRNGELEFEFEGVV